MKNEYADITDQMTPRERLLALVELLELEQPQRFRWNFMELYDNSRESHCGTVGCAIGLGVYAGLTPWFDRKDSRVPVFSELYGMDVESFRTIFGFTGMVRAWDTYGCSPLQVTPGAVAQKIKRWIDENPDPDGGFHEEILR